MIHGLKTPFQDLQAPARITRGLQQQLLQAL